MAQEQAPAVGTVLDGYRFKGGDPSQESSWEQVEPIDVSAQYGAGARQLPNGVIERVGPQGGVQRIGSANGGQQGGASALVGADARARFMINLGPLQESEAILSRMDAEGYRLDSDLLAAGLEAIPFDGGFVARTAGGADYNAYTQAAKTFEAAILPIMSGAAVTPTEAQRMVRAALPQPGDSPEVLAQKAVQRRQMINAVAQGIGQEAPYSASGRPENEMDENGLPVYGGPVGENAEGGPPSPAGPGAGPDSPVDISGMSANDLLSLQPGQYIRFPDGRVERLSGAPRVGAAGEEVSPGVFREERPSGAGYFMGQQAFARSALEQVPFGDEIAAGIIGAVSPDMDYRQAREAQRGLASLDREVYPIQRNAGGLAGVTAQIPLGGGAARWISQAPALRYAMTRGAAVGGGAGALYGAGAAEGGAQERAQGATSGLMTGALVGGAAPPIARGVGRLVQPVAEPIGDAVRAMTGQGLSRTDRTARTLARGVDPAEAQARASTMREFGAEPTFADIGGSGVQGRVRAAATRQTPGREMAQDFAAGRRGEVQDFTAGLAQRVSPVEATPQQLDEALEQYQRRASGPAFDAVRGERISLDQDSVLALRNEEGRAAIRDAARLYQSSTDEGERAIAAELNRLADDVLDNPGGVEITVGAADLIARHMNKAGGSDLNRQRVFGALGRSVRNNARAQSPGYGTALDDFAQRARLGDATEIGERFVGRRGYTGDFVRGVEGLDDQGRQLARISARSAMERSGETARGAPGLLDSLATDRGQMRRSVALLGQEGAQDLRRGAQVGRGLMTTANNVNPRAGSNTYLNTQDGESLVQGGGVVGNALRGRFLQAAGGVVDMIRSRGFNDQQAQELVEMALDPSRTDEVIQILQTRLQPTEAQAVIANLRGLAGPAISAQAGAAQGRQVRMVGPQP